MIIGRKLFCGEITAEIVPSTMLGDDDPTTSEAPSNVDYQHRKKVRLNASVKKRSQQNEYFPKFYHTRVALNSTLIEVNMDEYVRLCLQVLHCLSCGWQNEFHTSKRNGWFFK